MKNILVTFSEGDRKTAISLSEDFLEFATLEHKGVIFEKLIKQLRKDRFEKGCHCFLISHHCCCNL